MNIRLWIVTAAMLLGASTQAWGAINGWTAIGPSGGTVNKIVYNPSTPNTVYAIAAGGFYRSLDSGATWQLVKSDFMNAPQDLAIDPSDSTRVYVVAPNYPSLYVSTDGGATLSAVASLPTAITSAWQVAVSQNGTTLYVTSGMQVFRSTDRANTWQQRTAVGSYSAARVFKLVIDPTDSNTLYASASTSATDAGIFATHDGALTWQLLTSGNESTSFPADFAINATNSSQIWSAQYNGVWFSSNRGVNWTNAFATGVSAIAIDPSNPNILYAGTPYGSVFRTPDAGVTWTDVTGNNSAGQLTSIAVSPFQDSQVLTGGLGGVSGTTTSGTQWSAQTAGLNSTTILGLSAEPVSDRIYMNVSSGGIYFSAAGAAATTPVDNLGSGGLLQLSTALTLNVTAMLAQPGLLSASLINGLAQSTDGGSTWSLVPLAAPGTSNQVFAFASSAANPQTILAATSTTLYRSADGGQLWTQATNGLPANAVAGKLVAAPSDPSVFYASFYASAGTGSVSNFGVYKSSDAGQSWAPANAGIASSAIYALTVDPTNANLVYTATDSALLKSVDGGATWKPMTWNSAAAGGYPIAVAVNPKHPGILYASSVAQIARSVDSGASWQTLRASGVLPIWAPSALIADPNLPENIVVATDGSGAQQFTVAPDLSLTVVAPPSPVAVGVAATYAYTLANLGPFDATGVLVNLQLPSTAQNISAVATGGTCTVVGTAARCAFGIARAGASSTITLSATAPSTGAFQMVGSVVGDQPDPVSSNNSVTTSESIANVADLSVSASGSATAQVGGAVSYTVVVANAGPNAAAAAQLNYQLAAGLTSGTVTSAGASCTSGSSGAYTCILGSLSAAKSVTVTINATAAVAGTQTSTATVTGTTTDLVASNNSATTRTVVTAPAAASAGGGGSFSIKDLLILALILVMQAWGPWARTRRYRL